MDQLDCDTCWAFSCNKSVTAKQCLIIKLGVVLFSAQQLVNNVDPKWAKDDTAECYPTKFQLAFDHIVLYGLALDEDYLYEAKRGPPPKLEQ